MGVDGAVSAAFSIHRRRAARKDTRDTRDVFAPAGCMFSSRFGEPSSHCFGHALPWHLSGKTSPFGEGREPYGSSCTSVRKLQVDALSTAMLGASTFLPLEAAGPTPCIQMSSPTPERRKPRYPRIRHPLKPQCTKRFGAARIVLSAHGLEQHKYTHSGVSSLIRARPPFSRAAASALPRQPPAVVQTSNPLYHDRIRVLTRYWTHRKSDAPHCYVMLSITTRGWRGVMVTSQGWTFTQMGCSHKMRGRPRMTRGRPRIQC